MSWHDRTINHWHCFLEAWYLVSSCVCCLLFDIKADLWEGKKGGMAALLPSNSLPTQGCKSLWKFYATEINLQPADPPPHAWKCGTDGAVLSVGITYWGEWLCTRTLSVFKPTHWRLMGRVGRKEHGEALWYPSLGLGPVLGREAQIERFSSDQRQELLENHSGNGFPSTSRKALSGAEK